MARQGYMYGPLAIYVAPVGTSKPTLITTAPSNTWSSLVRSNLSHYHEDGIMLNTTDTYNVVSSLGSPDPQDVRLTNRETRLTARVMDVGADVLAMLYGFQAVTTVAASTGIPGTKEFEMSRSSSLETRAVLMRGSDGPSSLAVELYLPEATLLTPTIEIGYTKGEPAAVSIEFIALQSASGSTGQWREQTAVATS